MLKKFLVVFFFAIIVTNTLIASVQKPPRLQKSVQITKESIQSSKKNQENIDQIDNTTQELWNEYQAAEEHLLALQKYNLYQKDLINSQIQETKDKKNQLKELKRTKVKLVPLLYQMLKNLEEFVTLDLPFLLKERVQRVNQIRNLIKQANVSLAEKYRRIFEAYQIENEYGRTIETYQESLEIHHQKRLLEFLRIGRIALFYQTLDGEESGRWDQKKQQWKILNSNHYHYEIKKALAVARKQTSPKLLILPIDPVIKN